MLYKISGPPVTAAGGAVFIGQRMITMPDPPLPPVFAVPDGVWLVEVVEFTPLAPPPAPPKAVLVPFISQLEKCKELSVDEKYIIVVAIVDCISGQPCGGYSIYIFNVYII